MHVDIGAWHAEFQLLNSNFQLLGLFPLQPPNFNFLLQLLKFGVASQ